MSGGKGTDLGASKDEKEKSGGGAGAGAGGAVGTEGRAERLEGEEETGESGGTYWIFWRTPEEWAGVLMDWIERTGQKGSVLTLYEIAEGEGSLAEGTFCSISTSLPTKLPTFEFSVLYVIRR